MKSSFVCVWEPMPEVSESPQMVSADERYRLTRRVTVVAALVNTVLAIAKIILGFFGQSQALIADGVHSLADLFSDMVVLFAAKHGSREADEEHPYGHGRIETVVTVGLGIFLIVVAVGILLDAAGRLSEPERLLHPTWFALLAAFLSIVANEGLYHYTIAVARRLNSSMLQANAWHHRVDGFSSIIALVGIAGALAGFPMLDAIAAIGVSLMIAKVGWEIAWDSLKELIDTALDAERVEKIRTKILSVDGVRTLHSLRTRRMGGVALVDVHILVVDAKISVSEGHQISEAVRHALLRDIDEVTDVTVHIDAEDDEKGVTCGHLPLRHVVEQRLHQYWADIEEMKHLQRLTLHYLDGRLYVEALLPQSILRDLTEAKALKRTISAAVEGDSDIAGVEVHFG